MENKEITLEALRDKKYYPEWSEYLKHFMLDCEEVIGQYVSQDELVKRMNNDIDNISYGNLLKEGKLGQYERKTKSITLDESLNNMQSQINDKNAIFFHEGIHAIRGNKDSLTGFKSYFTTCDGDRIIQGTGMEEVLRNM